ncbi:MAG: MFS transporter [Acidimicrobiales bacterium]
MSTSAATAGGQRQEHWTATDTWTFVSFALGLTLEAYIFGMAPVATGWVKEPVALRSLMLSWAPLWLIIGIAIAGPVGDWLGRKTTFYITMSLYGVGAIGLFFSSTYVLIMIFLAILLAAAGGEMNMILAASHEVMPNRHRSKATMLAINFINMGSVIIALVDLSSASAAVSFQRDMVAATLIAVLVVLVVARRRLPESARWMASKGRGAEAAAELDHYYGPEEVAARRRAAEESQAAARAKAVSEPPRRYPALWLRITAIIMVAFSGTVGFGLLTYTLGPTHFPKLTGDIILVAGLVGFASGVIGFWGDKLSRKNLLVIGYAGAAAITAVAWATESVWVKTLALFWVLLVAINVFTNIGYLTQDTLKGEIWPTRYRSRFTALVRFVSIGGYIGTIYWTQSFSTTALIGFNLAVWVFGLAGALLWFFGGVETGQGTSIEMVSGDIGGRSELPGPELSGTEQAGARSSGGTDPVSAV